MEPEVSVPCLQQSATGLYFLKTRFNITSHTMSLNLISVIIFGEKYKLWSSLLSSFLQPSSLLGPNTPLRTLFSNKSFTSKP